MKTIALKLNKCIFWNNQFIISDYNYDIKNVNGIFYILPYTHCSSHNFLSTILYLHYYISTITYDEKRLHN